MSASHCIVSHGFYSTVRAGTVFPSVLRRCCSLLRDVHRLTDRLSTLSSVAALIPPATFLQVLPQLPSFTHPPIRMRTFAASGLSVLHTPPYGSAAFASRLVGLLTLGELFISHAGSASLIAFCHYYRSCSCCAYLTATPHLLHTHIPHTTHCSSPCTTARHCPIVQWDPVQRSRSHRRRTFRSDSRRRWSTK